uniref:Uncharacterized protein n=1 Tax=Panagrellus redivivus TaxID=6233 RepID=A0A7E4V254_PANRE
MSAMPSADIYREKEKNKHGKCALVLVGRDRKAKSWQTGPWHATQSILSNFGSLKKEIEARLSIFFNDIVLLRLSFVDSMFIAC